MPVPVLAPDMPVTESMLQELQSPVSKQNPHSVFKIHQKKVIGVEDLDPQVPQASAKKSKAGVESCKYGMKDAMSDLADLSRQNNAETREMVKELENNSTKSILALASGRR